MGIEYKLTFKSDDPGPLLAHLARSACGKRSAAFAVEFRRESPVGAMPNATFAIAPHGGVFCDYGSEREFLGRVVEVVISYVGEVTVSELEP